MDSSIVAPTQSYPAVVLRDDGLYLYPTGLTGNYIIEYLAKPATTPNWGYTMNNGRPVHNAGADVNFEFEDGLFKEISSRILQYVGVNLKDTELAQLSTVFMQKESN